MKSDVRKAMIKLMREQSQNTILEKSLEIEGKVLALPFFAGAERIFSYVSMPEEVQAKGIILKALEMGKKVYAPCVEGAEMKAYQTTSLEELLLGRFGILEPAKGKPCSDFDIMLVPGIAFDKNGNRLGRGGGYFDRFLSRSSGKRIGLAFDFQVTDLEKEEHDIGVDIVVTEKRIIQS